MKKTLLTLITIAALWSCNNHKKETTGAAQPAQIKKIIDSSLVTDSGWGAITPRTDFTGLQNIFGVASVKDERICGPECIDSIDVTKIYPGTNKEIVVYWRDSFYHKQIVYLQNSEEGSPYRTPTGLKVGSTLKELLDINGQKISFSGFGWDYGGYIQSFNKGSLDSSAVHFRLDLIENGDNALFGDTELNTDMPVVKKALDKIKVYQISLTLFNDPLHEH